MRLSIFSLASIATACALVHVSAHAIDKQYARKLERSGCTQATEAQGCDINKTKAQNARAGFGAPSKKQAAASAQYKDLVGQNSISSLDTLTGRGFKSVDAFDSGNTQYGIFYHPSSRLCVQLTMADGKVLASDDIKTHPKCR